MNCEYTAARQVPVEGVHRQATRRNLEEALSEASAEKLEPLLADMRDLNHEFSITATARYLKELRTRKQGS